MERTRPRRRRETPEDAVLRLVQLHAADLLRFAHRFSWCTDDAHDAYQRALEILVRRMRTAPPEKPLEWLRTVLKHEALIVREQREQLVARREVDLDREEARHLEDPVERAVSFERLQHTAEALRRLKPQEVTALVLRAEGLTYREIAERQRWTYTKVNRAVTEGRRALLARLGAIESGAECARWLPLLSQLADGELGAQELAELRPHLRACPGCRGTLRRFHRVPGQVAALVPPALVPLAGDPGAVARHVETAVHALLERATTAALRVQGALDAVPGTKLAAVAASSAAIAGGGVAIEQGAPHATAASATARAADAAVPGRGSIAVASAFPDASSASRGVTPTPRQAPEQAAGEFSFEASQPAPPAPRRRVVIAHAVMSSGSPAPERPPPPRGAPAEFAGP